METRGGEQGPKSPPAKTTFRRLLRYRYWIYVAVILGLLLFRGIPALRSTLREGHRETVATDEVLTLAGLDLAPRLIPRLAESYRDLYPELDVRIQAGGTRQALENLFNRRADVAFLSRTMTSEEEAIVRQIGDSALTFPVALGAIAVLAAESSPLDSLGLETLKRWVLEGRAAGSPFAGGAEFHLYAADPNLGLWDAFLSQLGLPASVESHVLWVASDAEVATAVSRDPSGLGVASLLALPQDLDRAGVRKLKITRDASASPAGPEQGEVATGEYPLYHYLYVACRPQGGAVASGFVSFLYSGRGQRLVEREGYLPAREVPREIQLTSKPVVTAG